MALRTNVGKLKDLLIKAGVIDELQARAAMGRLEQWGGRLPGVVVDMGFCDDEKMMSTLAKALGLPTIHLGMAQKNALMAKMDAAFCSEHCIFPVSLQNRVATIAMSDPTELDTIDALQSKLGVRVQIAVASENEIRAAIAKHYHGDAGRATGPDKNRQRDAAINATAGEVFELDTTTPDQRPEAPRVSQQQQWMNKPPSANTMLDEFLDEGGGGDGKTEGFTPEEVARIAAAQANQGKAASILRALQSLLTQKGYLR